MNRRLAPFTPQRRPERRPERLQSARREPEQPASWLGPNPEGLQAALAELEQTTQALRQLLLNRNLRRLAGEDSREQHYSDLNQARTLLVRLEPLTEQAHAHSRLDTHWRSGRLDHRGLGANARRPEAQARQLIRTLVWRSFTPQERDELRGLVNRMDQELATEISDAYQSLIIGWAPGGTLDWLGWANGPGIEAAVSALVTALEGGDPETTRAAAAELALFVPPPEDSRQTPPRWGHLVRSRLVHSRLGANEHHPGRQRLASLMRRPLGPGAAHPAPDSHPYEPVWRPTAAWYQALNEQRVRAGLRPYPRLGLAPAVQERA